MRNLARWLIARETAEITVDETKAMAAFRVSDKLGNYLSKLGGTAGFQSLLSRALTLAKAEAPWLVPLEVKADGSLEGLGSLNIPENVDKVEEGGVILLAQLLGLLATFIGGALMLRLLHDVWPGAPFEETDLGRE